MRWRIKTEDKESAMNKMKRLEPVRIKQFKTVVVEMTKFQQIDRQPNNKEKEQ